MVWTMELTSATEVHFNLGFRESSVSVVAGGADPNIDLCNTRSIV